LYAESNIRPNRFNTFTFASRKLPEYMHYRLLECRPCDLLYASPAPTPAAIAEAYRKAAYDAPAESVHAARTYGRLLGAIARQLPSRQGALDIGTGDGTFLAELLRAGFTDVVGLEPSSAPIAAAPPGVRPLIRQEMFRADNVAPQSLSLITCFQTIEHLDDPLAMCRTAWHALRPGAALLLIGHNRRALSARLLGRKSPIFDVEHLQLFSPASLRHLLQRAGFAQASVSRVVNRYPLTYWARLFPLPTALKGPLLRVLARLPPGRWPIPLPAGNLAALAFKRLT
jgi:SAM-dependent methyltransferase